MDSSKVIDKIYKNSLDIYTNLERKKLDVSEIYNLIRTNRYKSSIIEKISSKMENNLINKYTK